LKYLKAVIKTAKKTSNIKTINEYLAMEIFFEVIKHDVAGELGL